MHELPLLFRDADGWTRHGIVSVVAAHAVEVRMPGLVRNAAVAIERRGAPFVAEVIRITQDGAVCAPLGRPEGIVAGSRATSVLAQVGARVGHGLLGCVTDAWGRSESTQPGTRTRELDPAPLAVEQRALVARRLETGVPALDAFVPLGHGQRMALIAGAGVGKTTLLRRLVDGAQVDARVIALVGERGREAAELVAELRSSSAWKFTTVVYATSDAPPAERLAAARTATAQAETLAESGCDVLLIVDSLTRVATAWREIAAAAGETMPQRGYPASLAGVLARLIERAGARHKGTLTGIYSVLVDGDDVREPVTDTIRALTDGHIILSRALAEAGRFPAIDVLRSVSRLAPGIITAEHSCNVARVRSAMSTLEQAEDLLAIGAYRAGADARLDAALAVRGDIERLLFDTNERASQWAAVLTSIAQRLQAA